jgi:hypothetical protein
VECGFDKIKLETKKVEANSSFRSAAAGKLAASQCGYTSVIDDHKCSTVAIFEDDTGESNRG